jgi:predicted DNA-binding transcriptional regulator AlpA
MVTRMLTQRKMLTAVEAARYCGLSASTFAKYRLYGGGPSFIKLGSRCLYDPIDLDTWIDAHRQPATMPAPTRKPKMKAAARSEA